MLSSPCKLSLRAGEPPRAYNFKSTLHFLPVVSYQYFISDCTGLDSKRSRPARFAASRAGV